MAVIYDSVNDDLVSHWLIVNSFGQLKNHEYRLSLNR